MFGRAPGITFPYSLIGLPDFNSIDFNSLVLLFVEITFICTSDKKTYTTTANECSCLWLMVELGNQKITLDLDLCSHDAERQTNYSTTKERINYINGKTRKNQRFSTSFHFWFILYTYIFIMYHCMIPINRKT